MLSSAQVPQFRRALLHWYSANQRALPWRVTRNPYRIWVSEVMLQQTRVAAVVPYYDRFLARFPDVQTLARAREATVLANWSGLGYYRRARHLHAAAREVAQRGEFPKTSAGLRALPGIGRYTAAAIASIAFAEPCAVVDGNVERVLSRLTGANVEGGRAWQLASGLLSRSRPGDFNQAMMELGATVCTPKSPQCSACPVARFCAVRGEHPRRRSLARERRKLTYALAISSERVLLTQRPTTNSLMPGMWELPELQQQVWGRASRPSSRAQQGAPGTSLFRLRHSILNTDYDVVVVEAHNGDGVWIPRSRLSRLPLTGLARKILRCAGIFHP